MRKIIFSLFIFLLTCSTTLAFEDTVERYPNSVLSDYWDTYATPGQGSGAAIVTLPAGSTNHVINIPTTVATYSSLCYLMSKSGIYEEKFSFVIKEAWFKGAYGSNPAHGGKGELKVFLYYPNNNTLVAQGTALTISDPYTGTYVNNTSIEIITSGGHGYIFANGIQVSDMGAVPHIPLKIQLQTICTGVAGTVGIYGHTKIDDLSTSSCIGLGESWTELSTTIDYTYKIDAYSSYPSATYKANLYSLSGSSPGKITSFTLSSQSGQTS